jgi:uncharacterized protein
MGGTATIGYCRIQIMDIPRTVPAPTSEQFDLLFDFLILIDDAMDIEELDGFFCGAIAGPGAMTLQECLPHVFRGKMPDFTGDVEASEILEILDTHWNFIADILARRELHFPILMSSNDGKRHGNVWAHGFMRAVDLYPEAWDALIDSEDYGGMMIAVMALHFENEEAPKLAHLNITDEIRHI